MAAPHLSDRDLARLQRSIHAAAGISLGPEKRGMIEARLDMLVRRTGRTVHAVLDALEDGDDHAVFDDLLDVMTTNYTSFFREVAHFDWLASTWWPKVWPSGRPLSVWCAAAATGEEPYSLAMTFGELAAQTARQHPTHRLPDLTLVASDVSRRALEVAGRGVYLMGHIASLDRARVRRWFHKGVNESAGFVRVRPELRQRVSFFRHNLLAPAPCAHVDLIFLRNVLIYFDDLTQARVIAHLRAALAPGGFLVVGHAENVRRHADGFVCHGHTILEKTS